MIRKRTILFLAVFFCLSLSSFFPCGAAEPERPDVRFAFDADQEIQINQISRLRSEEAFEKLKEVDFLIDEPLLQKAIYKTFRFRVQEGIALALDRMKLPRTGIVGMKRVNRGGDFYVAKMILEVFPDEAMDPLLKVYGEGDSVTRGNIIRASGRIAAGQAVRDLLIGSLDDQTLCEEESVESDGEPLRLCDLAYNQLVLRYRVRNVLRAIGTGHKIKDRDYHIEILKNLLRS